MRQLERNRREVIRIKSIVKFPQCLEIRRSIKRHNPDRSKIQPQSSTYNPFLEPRHWQIYYNIAGIITIHIGTDTTTPGMS